MGIPGIYPWLKSKIHNFDMNNVPKADYFLIDCNGVIHESITDSKVSVLSDVCDVINKGLLELIEKVSCNNVYLSVDGIASLGKIFQMRSRRYKSEFKTLSCIEENCGCPKRHSHETDDLYNRNFITPNTNDMLIIMDEMIKYFKNYSLLSKKKIIIDTCENFGEGEHKIVEYIKTSVNPSDKVLIYGPDNDYLLLTLPLPHDIVLCRYQTIHKKEHILEMAVNSNLNNDKKSNNKSKSKQNLSDELSDISDISDKSSESSESSEDSEDSDLKAELKEVKDTLKDNLKVEVKQKIMVNLDIRKFRYSIPSIMGKLNSTYKISSENRLRCIYDFIAILGLAGMDFLPNSPSIRFSGLKSDVSKGRFNSIDDLINIYKQVCDNIWLVEADGRLNCYLIAKILEIIGKNETKWFSMYETNKIPSDITPVNLGVPGYKSRWYRQKFGIDNTHMNISSIFNSYIRILSWYVLLYINGMCIPKKKSKQYTASWTVYYPYQFAPLASDITGVKIPKYNTFEYSEPIDYKLQHMLVFSKNMLYQLDSRYYQIALKYPNFYPDLDNVKIDYELSENREHKGIVLLPYINHNQIKNELDKVF